MDLFSQATKSHTNVVRLPGFTCPGQSDKRYCRSPEVVQCLTVKIKIWMFETQFDLEDQFSKWFLTFR